MNRYHEYLKEPKSISFEECITIYNEILDEVGADEEALEYYEELIEKSIEYTKIRAEWTIKDPAWRRDIDELRTMKHNSVIVKFNQLARHLRSEGKSAKWRDDLGHEEDDKYNRKRIGDMACFLVYVHGLSGR